MPAHLETKLLPYKTSQIYQLVADIEKYPEFLPWCRAARILERVERIVIAELVICYKGMCEQYTSRVLLTPPADAHSPAAIDVSLVKGPFSHLTNNWKFIPAGEATKVEFDIDFAFRTKLLEKLMSGFFNRATHKMVEAFTERANNLYT